MHPMRLDIPRLGHIVLIYLGALAFGILGDRIELPLPWVIGAMVFSTSLRLLNLPVQVPAVTRPIGQVLIASSVGLSVTSAAVIAVTDLFASMIAAALLTILAGFMVAGLLMRLTRVDVITATLASIPMGPVESRNLAERHGVLPGPIVFTQTLRILMLVVFIPPVLVMLSDAGQDPTAVLRAIPWTPAGAFLLCACAVIGAFVARMIRLGNPFFLGALGGAALAAALGLPISAYPYPVLVTAQIFLGVWLGAVFDRQLLRKAGSFIPGAVICSLLLAALCAGMGVAVAWLTGEKWTVMILATAPGSVTEMALTAKILQEGVAVVTAFHLVRIFIILPFAPLIISLTARLARMWGLRTETER